MAKKRLKTLEDCRRYLAGLVNRLESGEIDGQIAGRLGYITNILISCIKDSDLETRIVELEKQLNKSKDKR
jgi:hypothetical protein